MNKISQECKDLLEDAHINLKSNIDFNVNGEVHSLSLEYIIDTFMQASEDSQEVFLNALKTAISVNEAGIEKFFEGMGQLLLMTHLSDKLEV